MVADERWEKTRGGQAGGKESSRKDEEGFLKGKKEGTLREDQKRWRESKNALKVELFHVHDNGCKKNQKT